VEVPVMIHNGELLEWILMMSELLLVDQMGLERTWSEEGNWAFSNPENSRVSLEN